MAQITTLSTTGTSGVIVLNPVAKSTTVMLSASTSSSSNLYIQATLDDPSSTPAPTLTWAAISSNISSSASEATGVMYTIVSPLGGIRIASTSVSATTTLTLKALQSVTA